MVKKKVEPEKPDKEIAEKSVEKASVVTQVVEIIETQVSESEPIDKEMDNDINIQSEKEDAGQNQPEDKKDEFEEVDDSFDSVISEEKIAEPEAKSESEPEKLTDTKDVDKGKQVVEDLFTKRTPESLTEISVHSRKPKQRTLLWALVMILVAVITGFGLIYGTKHLPKSGGLATKTTPTPAITAAPSPTPTISLDKTKIGVQVLNGGGVAGAGSKMKTFLTDKGYNVKDVGNAKEYNFENTEILVKSDNENLLEVLKTDLSSQYTVGTASATLPAGSLYDAQVTVGKQ
jgi:hypothetical protein